MERGLVLPLRVPEARLPGNSRRGTGVSECRRDPTGGVRAWRRRTREDRVDDG